jgi:hypothetical protein
LLFHPACKRLREQLGINVNTYARKNLAPQPTQSSNTSVIQKDKSINEESIISYPKITVPGTLETEHIIQPLSILQNYSSVHKYSSGNYSRNSSTLNISLKPGKENRYSSRNFNSRRDSVETAYSSVVEKPAPFPTKHDNSAKKKLKLALNQMQKAEESTLKTPKFAPFKLTAQTKSESESSTGETLQLSTDPIDDLDKYVSNKGLSTLCSGYKKALYSGHDRSSIKSGSQDNTEETIPKK